ncbi:MAG: hypothetical protein IKM48_06015, partial [Clostridia bacterium]|nr:hypothetical protein [Clostridia bacterium]
QQSLTSAPYRRLGGSNIKKSEAAGLVIIEGEGNIVNLLTFTTQEARLILRGKARETTTIMGVSEERIVKM